MPSDIANEIVDKIFGDEKSKALDAVSDALGARTYELIQQRKLEFAKTMGFDLGDTAQDAADAVADALPDNIPDEEETPETEEETTDETDS